MLSMISKFDFTKSLYFSIFLAFTLLIVKDVSKPPPTMLTKKRLSRKSSGISTKFHMLNAPCSILIGKIYINRTFRKFSSSFSFM